LSVVVNIFLSNDQTNFVSCEEEEERRRKKKKRRRERNFFLSGRERGKKIFIDSEEEREETKNFVCVCVVQENKFKKEKLSFHSLHFNTHN